MRTVRMAWRNVWRNSRRSVVTIAAMTFALWVMILYGGLVDGMLVNMERDAVDLEVGELMMVAPGYRDDPSIFLVLQDVDATLRGLDALGYRAAPRLLGGGLGAVDEDSAGLSLVGIDVGRDAEVTTIADHIGEGQWLSADDEQGVVLGRRLARTLHATIGSELMVLSQGADGSIANDLFPVRGILTSVGSGDRTTVFMTEPAFREFMVLPTGAHQITIRVPQGTDLTAAQAAVEALAPTAQVQTWRELLPTLATMIDSTKGLVYAVAFIVYLAIAILILNAMLMAVFERIREFGVMKAIGFGPSTVYVLITVESAIQALLATALGVGLAVPAMWYLQTVGIDTGALGGMAMAGMTMMQRWTGVYTASTVLAPVVILWGMVAAAVQWPAAKAARLRPLDAMRYR